MTSLHVEMLEELAKRAHLFKKDENKKVFLYESTGSTTIDLLLLDFVNGVDFNLIKIKIETEIKVKDYAKALVYIFQKLDDGDTFNADEIFNKFNRN